MKQKLCIAAKPSWISLMIFNWEPYCFFLSSVVAKYDSGDLTPESNCVDILLCENPSKLLFWLRLWPLSFPLCKSQLNLPTALWGGKKWGEQYRHGAAVHLSFNDSGKEKEWPPWVHVQYMEESLLWFYGQI